MDRRRRAWRALAALSWPERRLLGRAWWMLPAAAIALRVLGFTRVRRLLTGRQVAAVAKADVGAAQSVARLVDAAARWNPVPATCLVRSLVLCNILQRLGLDARLHMGVAQQDGSFEAHAWVEHHGIALAEAGTAAACYTPLHQPASHGSA